MTQFLLFLFILWLIGAILANIIMLLRTITFPFRDCYTLREYLIGFIGSWYTCLILVNIIKDEDL